MDWSTIRSDFPVLGECVYLNTASASATPAAVAEAVEPFFEEKSRGYLSGGWNDQKDRCQRVIADHIGADPEEIVFVSNTTEAINLFAAAVDWTAGDEILITEGNFPSNVYPWQFHTDETVAVRTVDVTASDPPTAAIESAMSDRTRVVAVPHVSAKTGTRLDLDALGEIATEYDARTFVDGIQAFGYRIPDVDGLDSYAAAAFKWLLGPFGVGIWYLDAATAEELSPPMVGYGAVEGRGAYDTETYTFIDGPQKFQYAHANYPGIYCLEACIEYLETIGFERIRDRVRELTGGLYDGLAAMPAVSVHTPRDHRGAIITFEHASVDPETAVDRLADDDIHVAARGGRIRVSPHFYNNRTDIDAVLAGVESL
ncbi:MAG: aminotransferase class V-fold PLP-dependent enzyme [Halobacteriales archaeon]|nr:aminotransferase class V-fold PLP-dependent enzyme [Halobacteriales archaeon]